MNIMLVSVTERTREIGLRMAVGAKGRDVLFQFLVEAVAISALGGLLGVGLGFGASQVLTQMLEWPTLIPTNWVIGAVGFAAFIGIFFGFYPAAQGRPVGSDRVVAVRVAQQELTPLTLPAPPALGYSGQEGADRQPGYRIDHVGRDLGQGPQHEQPLSKTRMRYVDPGC